MIGQKMNYNQSKIREILMIKNLSDTAKCLYIFLHETNDEFSYKSIAKELNWTKNKIEKAIRLLMNEDLLYRNDEDKSAIAYLGTRNIGAKSMYTKAKHT